MGRYWWKWSKVPKEMWTRSLYWHRTPQNLQTRFPCSVCSKPVTGMRVVEESIAFATCAGVRNPAALRLISQTLPRESRLWIFEFTVEIEQCMVFLWGAIRWFAVWWVHVGNQHVCFQSDQGGLRSVCVSLGGTSFDSGLVNACQYLGKEAGLWGLEHTGAVESLWDRVLVLAWHLCHSLNWKTLDRGTLLRERHQDPMKSCQRYRLGALLQSPFFFL